MKERGRGKKDSDYDFHGCGNEREELASRNPCAPSACRSAKLPLLEVAEGGGTTRWRAKEPQLVAGCRPENKHALFRVRVTTRDPRDRVIARVAYRMDRAGRVADRPSDRPVAPCISATVSPSRSHGHATARRDSDGDF